MCNIIFVSTANRVAYRKCQRIIYYGKLISYINDSLFRDERLLMLVGLLEHYNPLKFFSILGYLIQDCATLKHPVQQISQSSSKERVVLNSGINSTLAWMNMSVVLNYNEIPIKAWKMGTHDEFILIIANTETISYISNDRIAPMKYQQLLLTV